MNFYFFLDFPYKDYGSSLDLFNTPSNRRLCNDKLKDCFITAYYTDGEKWISHNFGILKKNSSILINKSDLPQSFHDKSVFISYSFKPVSNFKYLENLNYMNSNPDWRANINIYNKFTSSSYQGEYPGDFIDKKISLVSCSPMLQKEANNYFYLINLQADPKILPFTLEIFNNKKVKIDEKKAFTNTVNVFKLDKLNKDFNENMFIFIAKKFGGIPIYFAASSNHKSLSLEHTHPPVEYLYWGDRSFFQKHKKKYWFNNESNN